MVFKAFKKFWSTAKIRPFFFHGRILAVDQKFKLTQNDINKSFDQLPKKNSRILAVDLKF